MKHIVTISRYWDNPQIAITVDEEHIDLKIDIEDFLAALKDEIGSVRYIVTEKGFEERFDKAALNVMEKIKEESIKAVQ